MMTEVLATFGPVYDAAHSGPTVGGALFAIGIGLSVLIYGWFHYFAAEHDKPLANLIRVSLICMVMIGLGIWEWIRTLRISN